MVSIFAHIFLIDSFASISDIQHRKSSAKLTTSLSLSSVQDIQKSFFTLILSSLLCFTPNFSAHATYSVLLEAPNSRNGESVANTLLTSSNKELKKKDSSLLFGLISGSLSRAAKEIVLHPIDTLKVLKILTIR